MFDQNFCVHCTSEEEAMQLLSILESEGYLWSSGRNPTSHTNWGDTNNEDGLWYQMRIGANDFREITYSTISVASSFYPELPLEMLLVGNTPSIQSITDFI